MANRYEIVINFDEVVDVDLNDTPNDVAERLEIDEIMEDFEIEEDGAELIFSGVIKQEAINEHGGIGCVIALIKDSEVIKDIRRMH